MPTTPVFSPSQPVESVQFAKHSMRWAGSTWAFSPTQPSTHQLTMALFGTCLSLRLSLALLAENKSSGRATLPITLKKDNLCFVHGSPNSQHEYLLPSMDGFAALERVLSTDADVLFCGHTHVPYERKLENASMSVKVSAVESGENTQQFQVPLKRIINAGSVGEPRHGRPNATYVIYDTGAAQVTLREVEYDYKKTCQAIIDKGLPSIFAWRLAQGMEFAERADDPTHVCEH